MIITVDGPMGSGKSSVCKMVAKELDFVYLDSGAMYRGAAYISHKFLLNGDNLSAKLENALFTFSNNGAKLTLLVDDESIDITNIIRTPEIAKIASIIAQDANVRKELVRKQQDMAGSVNLIADGRDMGTKVFPDAEVKVYLDASPEERADRRLKDYHTQGIEITLDDVMKDLIARDNMDKSRTESPLMVADGAHVLDTTNLSMDEVVKAIVEIAKTNI